MADSTIESLPNKSKNNNNRKEMDQSRMVKIDEFKDQQQQQRSTPEIDGNIRTTKIVARKSSSSSIRPQFEPLVNHDQCSRSHQIPFPKSCDQLRLNGVTCDGMYTIVMDTFMIKHLFCDQSHMGGGWTVMLRRGTLNDNKFITFDHTYLDYRSGFGDFAHGEFFLGLETISMLTNTNGPYMLQIDMEDLDGEYIFFQFDGFRIGSSKDDFRFYFDSIRYPNVDDHHPLSLEHYRTLASQLFRHNGTRFITADRARLIHDIDKTNEYEFVANCAQFYQSGWWYGLTRTTVEMKNFTTTTTIPEICQQSNGFQFMTQLNSIHNYHQNHRKHRSGGHHHRNHVHHNRKGRQYHDIGTKRIFRSSFDNLQTKSSTNGDIHGKMFWSNWFNGNGQIRELRYVMMKFRPIQFD
ncbi:Fibrinogen C domain containing 1 [Blomia tropicalis]|nr:Fibrinogen C domain containing 1 [Blomia tropicalis]